MNVNEPYLTAYKAHFNFSWANQEKKRQSTNIKRDEINIMIINDKF